MHQLIIEGNISLLDIFNTSKAIIISMDNIYGSVNTPIITLNMQQIQQVIDYLTEALT